MGWIRTAPTPRGGMPRARQPLSATGQPPIPHEPQLITPGGAPSPAAPDKAENSYAVTFPDLLQAARNSGRSVTSVRLSRRSGSPSAV